MNIIRKPAVAGTFYTDDPDELREEIEEFFARISDPGIKGKIQSLIVPHAGYLYSGYTAAHAYKLLKKNPVSTIILISPSHREYFAGISIYNGDAFRTPLGDIPLDNELCDLIAEKDRVIIRSERGHRAEHAIEVQLPFLQVVLKEFSIVPITIGDQRPEFCDYLSDKLSNILSGRSVIIVASTDLSHYHNSSEAEKLDSIIISDIEKFDYNKLMSDIQNEKAEACGGGPAVITLSTSLKLGATHVKILHRCNSGDITGDQSAVVGYVSAAIYTKN
jgi:AmmeMemoRadiSam system protein B